MSEAAEIHLRRRISVGELGGRHVDFLGRYYGTLPQLAVPPLRRRLMTTVQFDDPHDFVNDFSVGTVLVAAHSGHFDLAAAFIACELGKHVAIPVRRLDSPVSRALFDSSRRAPGLDLLHAGGLGLAELRARLKAGQVLVLTLDRNPTVDGDAGTVVNWFGLTSVVRRLAGHLAATTGSPVRTAHIHTTEDGTGQILTVGAPHYTTCGTTPGRFTQSLVDELSGRIRQAPWEWHVPVDADELPWQTNAYESVMAPRPASTGGGRS